MPSRRQAYRSPLILFFVIVFGALPIEGQDTPVIISIRAIPGMQFDKVRFTVKPLTRIKLRFFNADDMDHNLLIVKPGARETVVKKALTMGAEGPAKSFIPAIDEVLWSIPLVPPEESKELIFTAPSKPGAYPYVCTYPGHGFVMYGVLHVSNDNKLPLPENDPDIPPTRRKEGSTTASHTHQEAPQIPHQYNQAAPYLYRVYIDGASPAAIVVNLPGNLSYCWDAGVCRLRFAWSGGFVDNTELWKGKGDAESRIAGTVFFKDKHLYPLLTDLSDPQPKVTYKGYRLLNNYPEFHYSVNNTEVFELIKPMKDGSGLMRTFRIINPEKDIWFITDPGDGVRWTSSIGKWKKGKLKLSPSESAAFTLFMNKIKTGNER